MDCQRKLRGGNFSESGDARVGVSQDTWPGRGQRDARVAAAPPSCPSGGAVLRPLGNGLRTAAKPCFAEALNSHPARLGGPTHLGTSVHKSYAVRGIRPCALKLHYLRVSDTQPTVLSKMAMCFHKNITKTVNACSYFLNVITNVNTKASDAFAITSVINKHGFMCSL